MVNERNLEHPAITQIQKTGYAESGNKYCDFCGNVMDVAYLFHARQLCEKCAENAIRDEIDEMGIVELAELLKVDSYEPV